MEKAEGQTATFTCVAINADLIYWKINGFAMSTKKFRNLAGDDVVLTDHPTNKSVSISNLTVPANMAINGARVVYNLVQLGSSTITTSHVTLNVQGTHMVRRGGDYSFCCLFRRGLHCSWRKQVSRVRLSMIFHAWQN